MKEPQWLDWARRLQALEQKARIPPLDPIHAEHFREVAKIAAEITSLHTGLAVDKLVELFDLYTAYATPRVAVRAVIFDGPQIFLVRELRNGLWTTPGGYAEVNETPSEAVAREVLEESGYEVKPMRLLSIRNLNRQADETIRFSTFYGLYFDCDLGAKIQDASPLETSESAFFPLDALPLTVGAASLSEDEARARAREHYSRLYELHTHPDLPADFD